MVFGPQAGHRLFGLVGIGQDAVIPQVVYRVFDGNITDE
jgi:hypothetical protein